MLDYADVGAQPSVACGYRFHKWLRGRVRACVLCCVCVCACVCCALPLALLFLSLLLLRACMWILTFVVLRYSYSFSLGAVQELITVM